MQIASFWKGVQPIRKEFVPKGHKLFSFRVNTFTEGMQNNFDTVSSLESVSLRAPENRKNSRSGPKLRILDRFQTPQNANKSVQQVCALNPFFPQLTNFHVSMSKKSQTVKSSQTDNVRAPFKCDIMVVKRL